MAPPSSLEAAWQAHLAADVPIATHLALSLAKRFPQTKWRDLQQKSLAKPDLASARALEKLAEDAPCRRSLEQVAAMAYQRAGAQEDALRVAALALPLTPRWDPTAVAYVCNTIAWSLYLAGRHADAVTWAERALTADPTQPFALGTLCEALGKADPERAPSVWKLLSSTGHDRSSWGDYVPPAKAAGVAPRELVFRREGLSVGDLHRLRIACRFDDNASPFERAHAQALALLAAGHPRAALLAATLSLAASSENRTTVMARQVIAAATAAVSPDFARAVAAGKGRFAKDPAARAKGLDALVKAKDVESVHEAVLDPHYGVSMAACQALVRLDAAAEVRAYLEEAQKLEYDTGQSILYDGFPKPFHLTSGAKTGKPEAAGTALVDQVIAAAKKGGKRAALSIPAPEPVPPEVLAKLVLAEGVSPSPSLSSWLAFDGGWLAREYKWFKNPEAPVIEALPVHVLVHDHLAKEFAPCFVDLPGKLAGALALPLEAGSESMRMLLLVPLPGGELPVIYVDVDDNPLVGVEAPGFDVWLATQAGLVGDLGNQYRTEIDKAGKYLFGKKGSHVDLDYARPEAGYAAALREQRAEAKKKAAALAAAWLPDKNAKKKRKPVEVPALSQDKLGEALAQAIKGGRTARVRAFLEDAKARFPDGVGWKRAAIAQAVVADDVDLVRELVALGADVETKYYLENRLAHCAASREDATMLRILLDAGARHDTRGYSKQTPLHDACDDRSLACVKLLCERGADLEARDQNGRTPLMEASHVFAQNLAAELPKTVAIARVLLDAGADPNGRNKQTSPLHEAIDQRNHELAKLLVEGGADVDFVDALGNDAWAAARRANDLATADFLARRKAGATGDAEPLGLRPEEGFEVAIRCSDRPQRVTVRARWAPLGYHSLEIWCRQRIEALSALAAAGMAGSDAFAPSAGHAVARVETAPAAPGKKSKKKATGGPGATGPVDLVCTMTLAGVAPAALALYVRGLYTTLAFELRYLSIQGELPGDGTSMSVDTARAISWLRDPATEPLRPHGDAMAGVPRVPARDRVMRLRAAKGHGAVATALVGGMEALMLLALPVTATDLRDRQKTTRALAQVRDAEGWKTLALLSGFGMSKQPGPDPGPLSAAFANGVAKLAGTGALAGAEWSLGVAGAPPQEGFDEELAGEDAIEESPSSRATCRTCRQNIEEGDLRLSEKTFTGSRYHHLPCAARKLPTRLAGALSRYDDEVPGRAALEAAIAKAKGKPAPAAGPPPGAAATGEFPYAELAPTGRAACLACNRPIAKDTVRVAVEREVETPQGTMKRPGYLHPACAKGREGVTADAVLARSTLDDAHRETIRAALT